MNVRCYVCICDGVDNLTNTTGYPLKVVAVVVVVVVVALWS
jgi:hypothetical protein